MTDNNSQDTASTVEADAGKTDAPSQKDKPERTEKEKAAFTLKKNAERLKELGGDPAEALNLRNPIKVDDNLSDDEPLTVGKFRQIQKADARQTTEQMVNELTDEDERTRIRNELKWILPSGDHEADFRRAQAAANADRNARITEEVNRKTNPRITAAGGSLPANAPEEEFSPTAQELVFMKAPYNMSKEKILAARRKS